MRVAFMDTLLIAFGAGVDPAGCGMSCRGSAPAGPWLLAASAAMIVMMLLEPQHRPRGIEALYQRMQQILARAKRRRSLPNCRFVAPSTSEHRCQHHRASAIRAV